MNFMQDGASIYTAHIVVKNWLAETGIKLTDWPHSPDLNPIEHCWRHMKERVHEIPNLKLLPTIKI